MSQAPQGLLFVFAQCEPDVSLKDFNDWYDNEHAPARLTVPGIRSAVRYRATDDEKPDWLALYDLDTPDVMNSPEYQQLRVTASDNERAIIPRLPILQRRIYSLLAQVVVAKPDALPGKYLLMALWLVPEEHEEEYNKWYDEEHMVMIARIPGWLRGRRYKLVEGNDSVPREGPPLWTHVAIHDFDNDNYLNTQEFKELMGTPWRKKVAANGKSAKRTWVVHKVFS